MKIKNEIFYCFKKKIVQECDILSIHVPLNKNTKNMISAKELK